MSKNSLALFDFDGTITSKDSLVQFIRYTQRPGLLSVSVLFLSPVLLLNKMGVVSGQAAKEAVLSHFFKGTGANEFDSLCESFAVRHIPRFIRAGAKKKIEEHLRNGHRVVIVTASPENWVGKWAARQGVECIGTRLETLDGVMTGKIEGGNCNGPEKVRRVKDHIDLSGYTDIYTYGDSAADRPMLRLGTHIHYKPFRGDKKT